MRLISFTLLFITLFSCQPRDAIFEAEFSVRDSLKTTTITVEVADFDTNTDPGSAVAYWSTWYDHIPKSAQLHLDIPGSNTFEVSGNVIRSYKLQYNRVDYDLLLRPGEDLTLQFVRDSVNGSYHLRAPDAPFTDQAARIHEVIAPPEVDMIIAETNSIKNLDSLHAYYQNVAKQRRERLAKLRDSGKYTDPLLLEYANAYIDNRIDYFFYYDVQDSQVSTNKDSLVEQYYELAPSRSFTDPLLFNDELIENLIHEQWIALKPAFEASKPYSGIERKTVYYQESVRIIDSLYDGFLHDFFLTRIYSGQLQVVERAPGLIADAERLARTTPYPSLSGPLREQLSVLAGEITPVNRYEQHLPKIPEGMDNLIPDILAQHAGKVVVLDFWATWCAPCIDEMKNNYPDFIKKYGPEKVAVVFLAENSPENIWHNQINQLDFSAIHFRMNNEQTSVVRQLFGITGIPHHTLFDQNGKLVKARASGPSHGLAAEIDKLLQ